MASLFRGYFLERFVRDHVRVRDWERVWGSGRGNEVVDRLKDIERVRSGERRWKLRWDRRRKVDRIKFQSIERRN